MARAVSTVIDVTVCLLLVSVAVSTLVVAVPDDDGSSKPDADPVSESLGTTTAAVDTGHERRSHRTLAGHLAAAAVANGSVDGERIAPSPYPNGVRRAVRGHVDERTHVTVRWRPYSNVSFGGRLAVGETPPPGADVSTTRRVLNGGPSGPETAEGFESLATSVSVAYMDRLFPPERTRVALLDSRTAKETATRYRETAAILGVDIEDELVSASTRRANERLADALAERFAAELEAAYPSAAAAIDDGAPGEIDLVVRRWEP